MMTCKQLWLVGALVLACAAPVPALAADRQGGHVCGRDDRPPPAPRDAELALVGQYGTKEGILDVSEACGRLYADGRGLKAAPLTHRFGRTYAAARPQSAPVVLVFNTGRPATAVRLGGQRLTRHDFGAEVVARIRATVKADPVGLRRAALAASPPDEPAPKRTSDLVSVPSLDSTIRRDTIYASRRNLLGIPIYERGGAFLQRPAAEALVRVSRGLKAKGYGLLITDAYRPWYATKMFWDATPPEDHNFVADPSQGSLHNRGCAVDLTLYDLKTGRQVEMTGRIDEMSARSFPTYAGGTSRQRWLRDLLRAEMEKQGFTVYTDEWWHFDYRDWPAYGIGTATYSELEAGLAH